MTIIHDEVTRNFTTTDGSVVHKVSRGTNHIVTLPFNNGAGDENGRLNLGMGFSAIHPPSQPPGNPSPGMPQPPFPLPGGLTAYSLYQIGAADLDAFNNWKTIYSQLRNDAVTVRRTAGPGSIEYDAAFQQLSNHLELATPFFEGNQAIEGSLQAPYGTAFYHHDGMKIDDFKSLLTSATDGVMSSICPGVLGDQTVIAVATEATEALGASFGNIGAPNQGKAAASQPAVTYAWESRTGVGHVYDLGAYLFAGITYFVPVNPELHGVTDVVPGSDKYKIIFDLQVSPSSVELIGGRYNADLTNSLQPFETNQGTVGPLEVASQNTETAMASSAIVYADIRPVCLGYTADESLARYAVRKTTQFRVQTSVAQGLIARTNYLQYDEHGDGTNTQHGLPIVVTSRDNLSYAFIKNDQATKVGQFPGVPFRSSHTQVPTPDGAGAFTLPITPSAVSPSGIDFQLLKIEVDHNVLSYHHISARGYEMFSQLQLSEGFATTSIGGASDPTPLSDAGKEYIPITLGWWTRDESEVLLPPFRLTVRYER